MGERAIASTNGYRLGLDWSNPPEGIDIQALTQAMNCEFDRTDNALRTVSGVTIAYDAGMSIDTLYYDVYRHKWYFTHGIELYETDQLSACVLPELPDCPCFPVALAMAEPAPKAVMERPSLRCRRCI